MNHIINNKESQCNLLVHIGYHKTATTWLQYCVFPAIDGLQFLSSDVDMWKELKRLKNVSNWDKSTLMSMIKARRKEGPAIISYEGILGNPFRILSCTFRNAIRIHSVTPDAHILMVLRRQSEHIYSIYGQYIQ